MIESTTKISVVIVNYRVKHLLEQCLHSVFRAAKKYTIEVFVVDNASGDDSIAYLQKRFPQVHYIANKENVGFSKANNQAFKRAKGEYILILNPDTVLGEHNFEHLLNFFEMHPDAGGVGVKMINANGRFLPESKRGYPTPWVSFCKIFGLSTIFPKSPLFNCYHLRYLDENRSHQVDILAGAYMMIPKRILDEVGYFDERFFMYGEDIDLSYRIVMGGYKNYYVPERILHYKGESSSLEDTKTDKAFYNAMKLFYKKHYPNSGKLVSGLIFMAIKMRSAMASLSRALHSLNKKNSDFIRPWLILCKKDDYDKILELISKKDVVLKDLTFQFIDASLQEDQKLPQIIGLSNIHNILISSECYSYENILKIMDEIVDKTKTFHLYNPEFECIISPGK